VLELEDLTLYLDGKRILDGINLDIWAGHIHAIVGPNGAGKTTLSSVVMGLKGYQDYEGRIRFDGRDMRGLGVDERARAGMSLASILAMHPKLVLLDEPDSGIDVASLHNIFGALQRFKSYGATVLLITHSATVLRQAEHAFLMCCGREIMKGSVKKILPYFEGECIPCDHQNRPKATPERSTN